MTRRIVLIAALVASTLVAMPAAADFSRVAVGLRKLGFERTWIPFLGLARAAVWMVSPSGVHDFQLAVYENTPRVSEEQLEKMVAAHMGKNWSPIVRVRSQRSGESVFIYARPDAKNERLVELIILAHERGETVLVRVAADAKVIGRQIGNPIEMRKMASR